MTDMLEITVNRRRFDTRNGVTQEMTTADIAGLAGVPAQNAVVEQEGDRNELVLVPCDTRLEITTGMHFLVTRHFVMGG
ncbi:hypothetical protein WNZ15_15160 [Roseibium sp. AS2]|uniref:hypothetical protein n=1 Tax=Roseibium sp. AS2 TaxID=3135781 RepID=UPI00316EF88A